MCRVCVRVVRSSGRSVDATFASDSMWATRIPTALAVMSIAAAVLLAIVVRERSNAESRWVLQQRTEAEAKARSEADAAGAAREDPPIDSLYGQGVATMGTAFHGVALGAHAAGLDAKATAERIRMAIHAPEVRIRERYGEIADVHVYFDDQDRCHQLRDALTRAWGEPSVGHIWLAPSHRRASYLEGEEVSGRAGCELRFDRYVDVSEWVASLPIDGIRTPSSLHSPPSSDDRAVEQLGANSYASSWSGMGLGATNELTDYAVAMVDDKVVWIQVTARNARGFDEVRSKLVERLKAEPEVETGSDTGEVLRWQHPVPVTVQHLGGDFYVMIGTPR
jgi:hypothetical protein